MAKFEEKDLENLREVCVALGEALSSSIHASEKRIRQDWAELADKLAKFIEEE